MFNFNRLHWLILTALPALMLATSTWANAASKPADTTPRTLVHLLDYLARDYAGAVQDGKIISESEYKEQLEFADRVVTLDRELTLPPGVRASEKSGITGLLQKIHHEIESKASPAEVSALAGKAREQIIRLTGITTTPAATPNLATGRALFTQRCAACHGADGHGDGPAAASLNPKPINFHDAKVMASISPLQIFHAVRLGVQGTAMAPQADLSDQDTWNVAYFALSFGHGGKGDGGNSGSGDGTGALEVGRGKLTEALAEYRAGHFPQAEEAALSAYLDGIEPVEPKLRANDPAFVSQIETLMMEVRASIQARKSAEAVEKAVSTALAGFSQIEARLVHAEMSPYMSFTAASAVLFREGFEAVLVVLAFLGVVRTSGNRKAEAWLHGGWVVALIGGGLAWIFSGWLIGISGAQREAMEAITSFFAAFVLLFVGFWLHQKTEIHRWKSFVETRVKAALEQKSLFGLASISFIAVFRETLETVLFLRAIWMDCGPEARNGMIAGVAVSFVATLLFAWAALKLSRKLPIRQLFTVSSSLMAALAVVLVGKGIHSLQETGTLSVSSLSLPVRSDLLGIFPTWQTWIGQMLIVGAIALLWTLGRRPKTAVEQSARSSAAIQT